MKKLAMSASSLLLAIMGVSVTSCGGDSATNKSAPTPVDAAAAATGGETAAAIINIRYIDCDSVLTHYQLAKDFQ